MSEYRPLVSIMMFCRNADRYIRSSVESVLAQDYANLEFVIQDGASTDGTLAYLQQCAERHPDRIKLVSEPDSGPNQAFLRALRRCKGDIIGCCLSDEDLLPGAVSVAVDMFRREPMMGALTGDADMIGADGQFLMDFVGAPFDLVGYLAGQYCPYWSSTYFSRRVLEWLRVLEAPEAEQALEFEVWCRLALEAEIKYTPKKLSKYRIHEGQLSHNNERVLQELHARLQYLRHSLFGSTGVFPEWDYYRDVFTLMQLIGLHRHLTSQARYETAALLAAQIDAMNLLTEFNGHAADAAASQPSHHEPPPPAASDAPLPPRPPSGLRTREGRLYAVRALYRRFAPGWLRKRVGIGTKRALADMLVRPAPSNPIVAVVDAVLQRQRPATNLDHLMSAQAFYIKERLPAIYDAFANFYHARGQIDQAMLMWKGAEPLHSERIDSIAVQAALKQPLATDASLLEAQRHWAQRHTSSIRKLAETFTPRPYNGKRKIRIGLLCGWWHAPTIVYQGLPWINEMDRFRFDIHAYSPYDEPGEIKEVFDDFHVVGDLSSEQLVEKFRRDGIDVLCEFSGFSPFHRFVAMAGRGASVQVSYLNHAGTSAVPNIDYVIADTTSLARQSERYYSEKVYRVPGCFFNFNYARAKLPRVEPPPFLRNGWITFGCFGSEGKINDYQIMIWAKMLQAVPESRLLLRNVGLTSPLSRAFMYRRFEFQGIAANRLRFEKGGDRMSILRSYGEIDISLDTWPYNGGNTIAESVWQGVPAVTLKGRRFSSAYGASILEACGLGDLVGESPQEFIEVCARLAADRPRLLALRSSLRTDVNKFGFSESSAFARKLEFAFEDMLRETLGMARLAPPADDGDEAADASLQEDESIEEALMRQLAARALRGAESGEQTSLGRRPHRVRE